MPRAIVDSRDEDGSYWVDWTEVDGWGQLRRYSRSYVHEEDAILEARRLHREHRGTVAVYTGDGQSTPKEILYWIEDGPQGADGSPGEPIERHFSRSRSGSK